MAQIETQIGELKEIVVELKADRAAQKEKEKKDAWTKYVSLTMVCLAVLTAIASQRGGGYTTRTLTQMNEATFNQANASDQWAFFQAKSIKQNLYEIAREQLSKTGEAPDAKQLEKVTAKIDKYEQEKGGITKEAKGFEHKRDAARQAATQAAEHAKQMGLAVSMFQVAIAIGGICLVVKMKPLWFVSLALSAYAIFKMFQVLQTPL